jgi:hypothetical protein
MSYHGFKYGKQYKETTWWSFSEDDKCENNFLQDDNWEHSFHCVIEPCLGHVVCHTNTYKTHRRLFNILDLHYLWKHTTSLEKDHIIIIIIIIIIGTNGENTFQRGKEQEILGGHPTPAKHDNTTTSQKFLI